MRTIILTGYDEKQVLELAKKNKPAGCYLCKRSEEGIFLIQDGEKEDTGRVELGIKWFSYISNGQEFMYPLCPECHMLLSAFVKRLLFEKEFGSQLNSPEK